jgi:hypothetical protein
MRLFGVSGSIRQSYRHLEERTSIKILLFFLSSQGHRYSIHEMIEVPLAPAPQLHPLFLKPHKPPAF